MYMYLPQGQRSLSSERVKHARHHVHTIGRRTAWVVVATMVVGGGGAEGNLPIVLVALYIIYIYTYTHVCTIVVAVAVK